MQVLHSTTTLIQSPYTFYFFVHHPFICLLLMITIVLHPYFVELKNRQRKFLRETLTLRTGKTRQKVARRNSKSFFSLSYHFSCIECVENYYQSLNSPPSIHSSPTKSHPKSVLSNFNNYHCTLIAQKISKGWQAEKHWYLKEM